MLGLITLSGRFALCALLLGLLIVFRRFSRLLFVLLERETTELEGLLEGESFLLFLGGVIAGGRRCTVLRFRRVFLSRNRRCCVFRLSVYFLRVVSSSLNLLNFLLLDALLRTGTAVSVRLLFAILGCRLRGISVRFYVAILLKDRHGGGQRGITAGHEHQRWHTLATDQTEHHCCHGNSSCQGQKS